MIRAHGFQEDESNDQVDGMGRLQKTGVTFTYKYRTYERLVG